MDVQGDFEVKEIVEETEEVLELIEIEDFEVALLQGCSDVTFF